MKSVEESGLSFGISRLLNGLACAEQNGLASIVNPAHLQLTNSPTHSSLSHSLLQQTHSSFNNQSSLDIENSSNHSKSSLNSETKLTNNENTLNLMNSFTHYNNVANIANHSVNGNFLNNNGLKTPIETQLKGIFFFKDLIKKN